MHLYIELTVKYLILHVFTWCLEIIPFLSPYSHLEHCSQTYLFMKSEG